ncbi:Zn-ribbon domain-containing OB-fold protein [Haladaptatus caseinilyticus]|uniref:Zn-ribbon domain-containing OB-fold protein n=1 Tax=Haladaptatus caseinilyticus TaxID=2993314 RepID=UPI00224A8A7D|nr:OB-fold domain-containing protein [Haladaptatus caseinilyticus]
MPLNAHRCSNGHLSIPGHPRCPECAEPQNGTTDLTDKTAEVVTWTTSTATPPGVRQPNHLAIVEFEVDGESVRTIGQLTTGDVEIGDEVRPVYAEELRDPNAGIRETASQEWDGYRFEPVE